MLKNCKSFRDSFHYQVTEFLPMENFVRFVKDFQDEVYNKDYIVVSKEDKHAIFTKGDKLVDLSEDVKSYKGQYRQAYKEKMDKIQPLQFDVWTAKNVILKGVKT